MENLMDSGSEWAIKSLNVIILIKNRFCNFITGSKYVGYVNSHIVTPYKIKGCIRA